MPETIPASTSWLAGILRTSDALVTTNPERLSMMGVNGGLLYERIKVRAGNDGEIFVHRWLKSESPPMHDHKYANVTIVLEGGFWEVTPKGRTWRTAGDVIFRAASDPHMIEVDPTQPPPRTLFITGAAFRDSHVYPAGGPSMPANLYRAAQRQGEKPK